MTCQSTNISHVSCLFRFRIDDKKPETSGMKNSFCFWGFVCCCRRFWLPHDILGNCALQILSVLRSFRNERSNKKTIRFLIKKWIISRRRLIQLSVRWVKQLLPNDYGLKAIFLRFCSFKLLAELNKSVDDFSFPSNNGLINYILLALGNNFWQLSNEAVKYFSYITSPIWFNPRRCTLWLFDVSR